MPKDLDRSITGMEFLRMNFEVPLYKHIIVLYDGQEAWPISAKHGRVNIKFILSEKILREVHPYDLKYPYIEPETQRLTYLTGLQWVLLHKELNFEDRFKAPYPPPPRPTKAKAPTCANSAPPLN